MKHTMGIVYAISQEAGNACYNYLRQIAPDNITVIAFEDPQVKAFSEAKLISNPSEKVQMIAETLFRGVKSLANSGATLIIIAANSVHIAFDRLREMTAAVLPDVKVLSIVDAVVDDCKKYSSVTIFGSDATISSGMYQEKLNSRQINVVTLDANEQAVINKAITEGYTPTSMPTELRQEIRGICEKLKGTGGDAVVLACTELSSLLDADDFAGLAVVDSNQTLAEYVVKSIQYIPTCTNKAVDKKDNLEPIIVDDSQLRNILLSQLHLPTIAAAVQLSLFDLIMQGTDDIDQLVQKISINRAGLDALVTLLTALGFLEKMEDKIRLTPISQCYLTTNTSAYWGGVLASRVQHNEMYHRLQQALQTLDNAKFDIHGKDITHMWQQADLDPEAAKIFTEHMHSTIYCAAHKAVNSGIFEGTQHLLDVGGGSGVFTDTFISRYPDSKASIFELPAVIPLINNYISPVNLEKIRLISGNFFEDAFPTDCDGILLSNILHDWRVTKVRALLAKAYVVLPEGGKIFIHEMLLNDAKDGPMAAASFNMWMYMHHGSQQFTQEELYQLLAEQGFKSMETTVTHPYYSLITAEK